MKIITLICNNCNQPFKPSLEKSGRINRSNYCSITCAKPKVRLIELNCSHCNKIFHKYPSQVKQNKETVFCGNQCVIDYRKIHWKGKIDSICINCSTQFKFNRAELKKSKGAGSYCSRKCQASGHEILKCSTCKKEFKAYKSNIKRGNGKYCSKQCNNERTNPKEFFFKNISYKNINDCWIWQGRKDKDGYGIMWNKKATKAHRYSYEIHFGQIPNNLIICHKCDNPGCVNPKHIYAGTHSDNAKDKIDKIRHKI